MKPLKLLAAVGMATFGLLGAPQLHAGAGAVYTMTNDAVNNEVLVFDRGADGMLTPAGAYETGGQGLGMGLANQGGVVLSEDERWLFAVNAGSSELSAFRVRPDGLELADTIHSEGLQPISVTSHKGLVYVLNEGGTGHIAGFRIDNKGHLSPIAGSLQPLSGVGVDAAQISFSPSGDLLVVTEKSTNNILTYVVDRDGVAGAPTVHASAGMTPYGFSFGKRGQLFVSEAAGGGAASTSSYQVSDDGSLTPITGAASVNGDAACWLVVTQNGKFAFTSNTASGNLSIFEIDFDGAIALAGNVSTGAGSGPLDSALTNNSRFFYVFNNGTGTISGYSVGADGSLAEIPLAVGGLNGANGLAAR